MAGDQNQQFCLRWNNHQSTIISNFDTLLESGALVDCTLAAEGRHLRAHKVVLSACSPYFEALLSEHYDKHPVFILKDVKHSELRAMMDYMYRGEVNVSQGELPALLLAAKSLQIKGLSDSGQGAANVETEQGGGAGAASANQVTSRPTRSASSSAGNIPQASSSSQSVEKTKVPRQSLQQMNVNDLPEDSVSPRLKGFTSREGSQSPTGRKRKRVRRRSQGTDDTASMGNHDASNSSDVAAPALGVAPVAEKTHAESTTTAGRSALMQQLTKPADELHQMSLEKPEPNDEMIQPKSEYLDDQESVEELTNLDDDMNDLTEMDQDGSRPGPSSHNASHGGIASWHVAGDQSNTSGIGAGGPQGGQDEVFLAAHEAAQAQRDSQDPPPIREVRIVLTRLEDQDLTALGYEFTFVKEEVSIDGEDNINVANTNEVIPTEQTSQNDNSTVNNSEKSESVIGGSQILQVVDKLKELDNMVLTGHKTKSGRKSKKYTTVDKDAKSNYYRLKHEDKILAMCLSCGFSYIASDDSPNPDRCVKCPTQLIFRCEFCKKPSNNIKNCRDHQIESHRSHLNYKCRLCSFSANTEGRIHSHAKHRHTYTECSLCQKKVNRANLKRHTESCLKKRAPPPTMEEIAQKRAALEVTVYRCHVCSFDTRYESDLIFHVDWHEKHGCEWCHKNFTSGNIVEHRKVCKGSPFRTEARTTEQAGAIECINLLESTETYTMQNFSFPQEVERLMTHQEDPIDSYQITYSQEFEPSANVARVVHDFNLTEVTSPEQSTETTLITLETPRLSQNSFVGEHLQSTSSSGFGSLNMQNHEFLPDLMKGYQIIHGPVETFASDDQSRFPTAGADSQGATFTTLQSVVDDKKQGGDQQQTKPAELAAAADVDGGAKQDLVAMMRNRFKQHLQTIPDAAQARKED